MTATLDDLSQVILAWLDERPLGAATGSPSGAWGTKAFQYTFRVNLESALRAAVRATLLADTIARLVNAFGLSGKTSSAVSVRTWSIAIRSRPRPDTFDVMRQEMANVLAEEGYETISGVRSRAMADVIVTALVATLSSDSKKSPELGDSPEEVLYNYMVPLALRRKYNVRMFLVFLGIVLAGAILYALVEPDAWLNPATGLFTLLAYITLVVTSVAHDYLSTAAE